MELCCSCYGCVHVAIYIHKDCLVVFIYLPFTYDDLSRMGSAHDGDDEDGDDDSDDY